MSQILKSKKKTKMKLNKEQIEAMDKALLKSKENSKMKSRGVVEIIPLKVLWAITEPQKLDSIANDFAKVKVGVYEDGNLFLYIGIPLKDQGEIKLKVWTYSEIDEDDVVNISSINVLFVKNRNNNIELRYDAEYIEDSDLDKIRTEIETSKRYKFEEKGKYGYCDKNKNQIIAANYDEATDFFINKAIVKVDNQYYLIDSTGNIVSELDFEGIKEQINQVSFIVKKDNLYGVYRMDLNSYIIPAKFDAIEFHGGHEVLTCRDNLWGLQSIVFNVKDVKMPYCFSIPAYYQEINILDNHHKYYGCKEVTEDNRIRYILLSATKGTIEVMGVEGSLTQFQFFDENHILASVESRYYDSYKELGKGVFACDSFQYFDMEPLKFGFVSVDGYVSIPFKYDKVELRKDGLFDVRIGLKWGVLSLTGREITKIKYTHPLPCPMNSYMRVHDAETGYYGVVNSKGEEIIPTIYEHLFSTEDESLFVFCFDGRVYNYFGGYSNDDDKEWEEEDDNLRSYDYFQSKSGIINAEGKIIIPPKYECYRLRHGFIMAGYDGWSGSKDYPSDVVYDLYTKKGDLLFGGFNEFEYDEKHQLFNFFFGGEWTLDDDFYGSYDRGNGLWLLLNKDLQTILRDNNGNPKQFSKGFIGKVTVRKEGNKTIHVFNMPISLMTHYKIPVGINSIKVVAKDTDSDGYNKESMYGGLIAIDIATGKATKSYKYITQITEDLFYYSDNNKVGITNINSEPILQDCFLITYPVQSMFFAAKNIEGFHEVILYQIRGGSIMQIATAIKNISSKDLVILAENGDLRIKIDNSKNDLASISVRTSKFWDRDFLTCVSTDNCKYEHRIWDHDTNYFISDYNRDDIFGYNRNSLDDDDSWDDCRQDMERDTWDAMTDGMYGDMPDGFDGDYEPLGF